MFHGKYFHQSVQHKVEIPNDCLDNNQVQSFHGKVLGSDKACCYGEAYYITWHIGDT